MPVKVHTLNKLKTELINLPKEELVQYCLRLAKYKKENKELINYLLFEAEDEDEYIKAIKGDISVAFGEINRDTLYYAKKNIRRILKQTIKHIKYSAVKTTEIELLLFFCVQMQTCGISFKDSKVMLNLYDRQIKNIEKALFSLHEDIYLDYETQLEEVKKGL